MAAIGDLFEELSAYDELRRKQVADLLAQMQRFETQPRLCYRVHPDIRNIELLVTLEPGSDLAAGIGTSMAPEERARRFLVDNVALFSFAQGDRADLEQERPRFDRRLFLKHQMRSALGAHCIFGWRLNGVEVDHTGFNVHLDRRGRVVMVSSVYQPDALLGADGDGGAAAQQQYLQDLLGHVSGKVAELQTQGGLRGGVSVEPLMVADWQNKRYELCLQVKLSLPQGSRVWIVRQDGAWCDYSTTSRSDPPPMRLAAVFEGFPALADQGQQVKLDDAFGRARPLRDVVLRELSSDRTLAGRYVAITDQISLIQPALNSFMFLNKPLLSDSQFDRQMAYYHVDLIQRYFRELGLAVLDTYAQLNPLEIVLDPRTGPLYNSKEMRIYIPLIGAEGTTAARDPRILYHEYVHAVTDALARLHRSNKGQIGDPRFPQILQGSALDEACADFFACSLAAAHGAPDAAFYPPPKPGTGALTVTWDGIQVRRLGGAAAAGYPAFPVDQLFKDLKLEPTPDNAKDETQAETLIYQWGEKWGQYLWHLRGVLGVDVAETLIAHSIFFLSRWATFGTGVLALALADQLLFAGEHVATILELGKPVGDWQAAEAPAPGRRARYGGKSDREAPGAGSAEQS